MVFVVFNLVLTLDLVKTRAVLEALLNNTNIVNVTINFTIGSAVRGCVTSLVLDVHRPFHTHSRVIVGKRRNVIIHLASHTAVLVALSNGRLHVPGTRIFGNAVLGCAGGPRQHFAFRLNISTGSSPLTTVGMNVSTVYRLSFILSRPGTVTIVGGINSSGVVLRFRI